MSSLARETADAMPEVLGKFAASRFFCFPTKWYGSFQTNAFSNSPVRLLWDSIEEIILKESKDQNQSIIDLIASLTGILVMWSNEVLTSCLTMLSSHASQCSTNVLMVVEHNISKSIRIYGNKECKCFWKRVYERRIIPVTYSFFWPVKISRIFNEDFFDWWTLLLNLL